MTPFEFLREYKSAGNTISVHTSGSTGKPKDISLRKELCIKSAQSSISFFGLTSKSRIHSCISFDFIGGKMTAVRALECGCFLTAEIPSNNPTLAGEPILNPDKNFSNSDLINMPIDLLSVVPSQVPNIIRHMDTMPVIKNLLIGGSAIPSGIKSDIIKSGITAWESYGMTETASHIALRKITHTDLPFTCLPGISVANDNRGCLVISRKGFKDVITNDIAEIASHSEFRIKGRIDNVIISGGKKFHPEEAESLLSKKISCQFIFTSKPNPLWGEAIVMVIADNKLLYSDSELLKICSECLERWQRPKEIIRIPKFSFTTSGKINRKIYK